MQFKGYYYNGKDSSRQEVTVDVEFDKLVVRNGAKIISNYPLSAVEIKSRVGSAPRYINFPDGGSCETTDNDAVDRILVKYNMNKSSRLVHKLESKKRFVLASLVITMLFVFVMVAYGVPFLSKGVAFALPVEVNRVIAKDTIKILDKHLFKPTELSRGEQEEIESEFEKLLEGMPDGFDYRVLFRGGGHLGANAVALPDGTVVVTDELVELADGEIDEIVSVLAHEIGHIVNRHGIRTILQDSILSAVAVAITGDVSSLVVAVPSFLIESKYSREFEKEADRFAVKMMVKHDIHIKHFANILKRLTEDDKNRRDGLVTYISTHPPANERIKLIYKAYNDE